VPRQCFADYGLFLLKAITAAAAQVFVMYRSLSDGQALLNVKECLLSFP
jgi:hypothetical protein